MTQDTEDNMVPVTDLNLFVTILIKWHKKRVEVLKHYLALPAGQVVQIDSEPELVITGDVARGFKLGVNMALMEIGKLPFSFELEDAPIKANADQSQA